VTPEFDYFTAVDDLVSDDSSIETDAGADMIGDVEYNSACYYKYFSIHPDALVDNLTGREFRQAIAASDHVEQVELAALAVSEFLRAAVMVSPSGKQNSFAAHQLPFAILVEVRPNALPISYANAFVLPVKPSGDKGLPQASFEKLKTHAQALTKKFGLQSEARWLLTEEDGLEIEGVQTMASLDELCEKLQKQVLRLHRVEAPDNE
jgi:CRISPR system Cascade subunit CasC